MFTKIGDVAIRAILYLQRKINGLSTTKLKVLTICSVILFSCLIFIASVKNEVICLIVSITFGTIFVFFAISLSVRYANEAIEKQKEEAYKRIRQMFAESKLIEVEIITYKDEFLESCVQVLNTLGVRHIATINDENIITVYSVDNNGKKIENTDVTIYNPLYFEKHYKFKITK